jgi:hypothetical protein
MKIILSRKGFDSAHGGIASPVFPEGEMLSFPIPSTDIEKDSIKYSELCFDGMGLDQILKDLGYNEQKYSQYCHLDPDIEESRRRNKVDKWEAAFGQINESAGYLRNQNVCEGDLFLFFGNFHHVQMKNDKYSYVRRTKDEKSDYRGSTFQAIWGYMQVEKVLIDPNEIMAYKWHPHACPKRNDLSGGDRNNTLYIPTTSLSFRPDKLGWGVFDYDERRVLTKKGCTKATWDYNAAYDVSVAKRKNSATDKDSIYYSGIWQELVLDSEASEEWAKSLF